MKIKNYKILSLIVALFMCWQVDAQKRYVEEVFTSVKDSSAIVYGQNISVLTFPVTGQFAKEDLVLDLYMPEGDSITERPLVIYFHTGNFLPNPANGSVSGRRTDSSAVNICTRLAKMGYVAASADYRLGWNPLDPDQSDRTEGLINAAYRGVQDSRTAVRFFKKSAAEGNEFNIDTTKITLWGQGTGGYITLASGALDSQNEIIQDSNGNPISKFLKTDSVRNENCQVIQKVGGGDSTRIIPMVNEPVNGDLNATIVGRIPGGGCPNAGDTLCLPNHVGHTSNFQLVVNIGGAMGDSSWLDDNDVPIISVQAPYDGFAPYNTGVLNVFAPNGIFPIVPVSGSNDVQKIVERFDLNSAMDIVYKDPYTLAAATKWDAGFFPKGLYPITGTVTSSATGSPNLDSAPWEYWDSTAFCTFVGGYNQLTGASVDCNGILSTASVGNPDMSPEKANRYIDTIMNFFAPRACLVLDLDCDLSDFEAAASNEPILTAADVGLVLSPNPAVEELVIDSREVMKDLMLFDVNGRIVRSYLGLDANQQVIRRQNIINGIYFARVRYEEGIVTKKVIFK